MSATDELLQDHIVIRRLQVVIERCYALLYEGRDVPFGDLVKISEIIQQFVDQLHHGKEEKDIFRRPKTATITLKKFANL
jgi:hemerythrin-like domain-containing protein